jgi:hypothetical protein
MRVVVQSFQAPRWIVPVLILVALALIPFALMLAVTLLGVAVAATAFRALLSPAPEANPKNHSFPKGQLAELNPGSKVIDAEYEAKDQDEKGN